MKNLIFLMLIFFSITLTQAQVPQSERDALIALYNATDGPNWTNNTNWNTSSPVSTWYGITVNNINGQDHVTAIDLSYLNLTGSLPAEIGDFPELTNLVLGDNNLSGSIPSEIGNLSNLSELRLYRNDLSGSLPVSIGNLSNLETLSIGGNNLSGNLPASMSNLSNLTYIYIWGNHFSGLLPDLSNSQVLKNVNIRRNDFQLADIEPVYTAIKNRCEANGGWYYYAPMNPVDTELSFDMVNGNNYTFNMPTIAGTNVTYQWYKNDVPIPGATSQTYSITNAQHSDLGDYTCKAQGSIIPDLTIDRNVIHLYGTVDAGDKAALLAIYNATDGNNWTDHTNWNSTQPVYTWFGVKMRGDRVSEIQLYHNNLNGSLPSEIGDLTGLIDISLQQNQLTGSIPPEIGNLTSLTKLSLYINQLSGNIPPEIGNLTNLKTLWLGYNNLIGDLPQQMGNLTNLEYIWIPRNNLTGNIPVSFSNLTKMKYFYIYGNQFSGDIPDVFGNWPDLSSFVIERNYSSTYNQFTGDLNLSQNSSLQEVGIAKQLLSTVDLRNGQNIKIEYFDARDNPNLTCIFVDDAAYSTANWTNIDPTTHFVESQAECNNLFQTVYVPDDNFENYLETHDAAGNMVAIGDQNSMGNGIANDDLVYKSRISNVFLLDISSLNISDLTGIEAFDGTHYLYVDYNPLINLDISGMLNLTTLRAKYCQLTSLILSNNYSFNQLDVSHNFLTQIDMSSFYALTYFNVSNNHFTSIDLSNNHYLGIAYVSNNNLNFLDLRNGNNTSMDSSEFNAYGNPDLTCIFVDDATYSNTNWANNIDPTAHFVETQAECDALNTPEFDQDLIVLYPNPVNDVIYIQNNGLDIKNIEVQNLTGQTVINSNELTQIDLSSLSAGMYLIKITDQNDRIGIYKIVKK